MSSQRAIHELMAQVGPVLDLDRVTEFAEDQTWHLVFDESTSVDVEYDDDGNRLMLTGDVGAVPSQSREKAFEALLRYNYLWTEHGGVRGALDGSAGNVVMMVEMTASGLDITRLCSVLQNFRAVVEGWRDVLTSIADGSNVSEAPFNSPGMIRG
ncbi:MAG: type secretion chaperone, CesT family [Proteobacteria bacterium]|nr:type secretion chaperone, CesT family [Pseudomonadota bacterium]